MDEKTRQAARAWTLAQPVVSAFVTSLVRDFRDRDDVLQEIAVAVIESFDRYKPELQFIAWALGIVRNQVGLYLRRRSRDRHVFDAAAVEQLAVAFESLDAEEVHQLDFLRDCLGLLEGRSRQLCELRDRQDLKPAAIAQAAGMSANAVSKALQRIRDQLRTCIERKATAALAHERALPTQMNDDFQNLIDAYLDDCLSPEEVQRLNDRIKASPVDARRLARAALLHDRLHGETQDGLLTVSDPIVLQAALRTSPARQRWTFTAVAAVAASLLIAVFLWHTETLPSASAAAVALDRLILAASEQVDRVYRIRVTDWWPGASAQPVFSGKNGRKPGIDGARLYVRGPDKFVLVRHFGDGSEFVNGSNGVQGWSVPPRGHVHLSNDPRRFRRPVPGEHEEVPFLDLESGLEALRRGYRLERTGPEPNAAGESRWSRLDAVQRSDKRRGPQRVRIWFDSSGVAHRIELDGLPADEGGARAVVLELIEQRDLGPGFFQHEAHHDKSRPVDWE